MSVESPVARFETLHFAGTVTRDQFSLVQRLLLPWWGEMKMTALCIVIVALIFEVGVSATTDTPLVRVLAALFWSGPMIVLVWGVTKFARYRQWVRTESIVRDITGSIGDGGVQWNTTMTTASYPWSKIIKVRQHPDLLLLFYSGQCAFYFPRQFFASDSAWSDANALAMRHFNAKAY